MEHITKLINKSISCNINAFDDIVDLTRYVKTAKINKVWSNEDLSSETHGTSDGWRDFNTFGESLEALEYGTDKYYTSFTKKFRIAKEYLDNHVGKKLAGFKNDVTGFVPIVPHVLTGIPVNMIASDVKPKKIPTARVFIDRTASSNYTAQEIIDFESLIFALIQVIENSGIRCEIYATMTAYYGEESIVSILKIKDYMQPLNLYKIQFPIVSPDFFRRVMFKVMETDPGITEHGWTYGYGRPLATYYDRKNEGLFKISKDNIGQGYKEIFDLEDTDVYIPSLNQFDLNKDLNKMLRQIFKITRFSHFFNIEEG